MTPQTIKEIENSALEYVAAWMYLNSDAKKLDSVSLIAKKRLTQAGEFLQQHQFIPHLGKRIPPSVKPGDYLGALGAIPDILIPHGDGQLSVRVDGGTAHSLCRKLYLTSI